MKILANKAIKKTVDDLRRTITNIEFALMDCDSQALERELLIDLTMTRIKLHGIFTKLTN